MKISIVIPVYNELQNIDKVLQRVLAAPLPPRCSKEIIVVDDGSVDGTTELLDRFDPEAKLIELAKAVKDLVDGQAKFPDWNKRDDIKSALKVE